MKSAKVIVLALLASALTACGSDRVEMTESTWLITNIYSSPEEPNVISDLVITQPTVEFGRSSLTGYTGCAPFQGEASYLQGGAESTPEDADYMTFNNVEFDKLPDDCQGQERLVHERLVDMLDGSFDITRNSGTEILLVRDVDELDKPSIRLLSWVAPE